MQLKVLIGFFCLRVFNVNRKQLVKQKAHVLIITFLDHELKIKIQLSGDFTE